MSKVWTTSSIKSAVKCKDFANDNSVPSLALEKGNMIHEMLEKRLKDVNLAYTTYRGVKTYYKLEHTTQEYVAIVKQVMRKHPDMFTEDWQTEVTLNANIEGYTISGIIDTFMIKDSYASAVDYKSGISRARKDSELDMLQGLVYAYLLFSNYPYITHVTFTFLYVEGDEHITLDFRQEDIGLLKTLIVKWITIARYSGRKTGYHCQWCKHSSTCGLVRELETNIEKHDMKTTKVLKKVCEQRIEQIKSQWLEEDKNTKEMKHFSITKMYYAIPDDSMTKEQLMLLLKDKVKVKKAMAEELKLNGIEVKEQDSYRVKRSAN